MIEALIHHVTSIERFVIITLINFFDQVLSIVNLCIIVLFYYEWLVFRRVHLDALS